MSVTHYIVKTWESLNMVHLLFMNVYLRVCMKVKNKMCSSLLIAVKCGQK
jgi:hypothetical protein